MIISVLYIHHSGVFGGASRSLLELVRAFPEGAVKAHLITQRGKVPGIFRECGVEVIETLGISQFDHTRFGYYRATRYLILLRELAYVPFTIWSMLKARWQWKNIDIVHVNEITNALSILLAKLIFRCPLVVHVRSVQQGEKGGLRKKLVLWLLKKADAVIAIDSTVRNSLPESQSVHIVHNGFNLRQQPLQAKHYATDEFSERPMKVLFVGGLVVMKGILDLVQAAKMCADAHLNVKFFIVGDTPREEGGVKSHLLNALGFSHDVKRYCRDYIAEHQLENLIEFSGFILDIESAYKNADVLCFPSHLNAVGRPVIEAALLRVPSIVAIRDAAEDTMIHQNTGICIVEENAQSLFDAVNYYYSNPVEISRMGELAYQLASENFNISKNSEKVLGIYRDLYESQATK